MEPKALALQAVKVAASAADGLTPARRGAVALLYHRIGERSTLESELPASLFDEQIALLAGTGRAITLDGMLEALAAGDPPALDPVAVTFDDGTADFCEAALPVLVRHAVPATVYVATDHVEDGRPFPHDGRPVSWAALSDAVSTGLVTVGSHTHRHVLLDRASPREAAEELDASISLIEDRLGVEAAHFAYPKGLLAAPPVEPEVRRRFRSAALAGMRGNGYGVTDPHRLQRSPVQRSDGMRWFRRKVDGGLALEGALRGLLNRRRYAGAST